MAGFTSEEYTDMLVVYGMADCNGREARRIYQERYPNRRVPNHQTFGSTYRRLRETGNLNFRDTPVQDEEENAGGEEEKKRQKRGGKGMLKSKKKEDVPKLVQVSRAPRGKKKSVTVVSGLSTFDIDLKVAAKFFGTKFACGSSVTGDDEIVIQGDVKDDLFDIIPEKWPEIDEDSIEDLGDQKR